MIDILKNIEKNKLPNILDNPDLWNSVDIKNPQPRTYCIWSKIDEYYISFSKTFYCNDVDMSLKISNDDIVIRFLDGYWELVIEDNIYVALDNNAEVNKEEEFNKKCFKIDKNKKFFFRSHKQRDWVYSITISKSEPLHTGKILNKEIKHSLLKSAKILIY